MCSMSTMTHTKSNRRRSRRAARYPGIPMPAVQTLITETASITWMPQPTSYSGSRVGRSQVRNTHCLIDVGLTLMCVIGPDEGGSDDAEELSVNTESADTTDQDVAESPQQTRSPQELIPSPRSRASNVAASRGLGIRVESSDGPRQGGLPSSPRPPARSPRSSAHPQAGAASGTSVPSQ